MHKVLAVFTCLLGLSGAARATINIEIDAGLLSTATGATLPTGSLLQLIASPVNVNPDGVFGAPTTTSFVTGNDILVASFAMNYKFSTGETDNVVTITLGTGAGQVPAGDALLLRWYSGTNNGATAPAAGSTYGQYRSDSQETNEKGLTWFVPSTDGSTYAFPTGLDFQTATEGGGNPDTAGRASNMISAAGVPEPSTYIGGLAGCVMSALAVMRRSKNFRKPQAA